MCSVSVGVRYGMFYFIKTIGYWLFKFKKGVLTMIQLIIERELFEKEKEKDYFINNIRLTRIVNMVRANQRIFVRTLGDDNIPGMKDRLDSLLFRGALLFEAIKTFSNLHNQFRHLSEYKKHSDEITSILNQFDNNNSFYNTVLKPLRNKVMFHFDPNAILESIPLYDIEDDIIYAQGESFKNIDFVYTFPDELALDYILKKVQTKDNDEERYKYIGDEIISLSSVLCDIIENLVGESLEGILKYKEV